MLCLGFNTQSFSFAVKNRQEPTNHRNEKIVDRPCLQAKGISLEVLADRVAELFDIPSSELWKPGKHRQRVRAKSLLCYYANRERGISMVELSRRMGVSNMAISCAVQRGEDIANDIKISLYNLLIT